MTQEVEQVPALRGFIERIERLNERDAEVKEDKRRVFAEAKSAGYDAAVMRRVIAIRAGKGETDEFADLVKLYLADLEKGEKAESDPASSRATRAKAPPPPENDGTDLRPRFMVEQGSDADVPNFIKEGRRRAPPPPGAEAA